MKRSQQNPVAEPTRPIFHDCGDFIVVDKRAAGQTGYFVYDDGGTRDRPKWKIVSQEVRLVEVDLDTGEIQINNRKHWFNTPEGAADDFHSRNLGESIKIANKILDRYKEDHQ